MSEDIKIPEVPVLERGLRFLDEFAECFGCHRLFKVGDHIVFEVAIRTVEPREIMTVPVHTLCQIVSEGEEANQ